MMFVAAAFSAILRVHPSRNPLSSPAWSLDRIAIHYRENNRRGYALISPVRREEFMTLLGQRARLEESPKGLVPIAPHD